MLQHADPECVGRWCHTRGTLGLRPGWRCERCRAYLPDGAVQVEEFLCELRLDGRLGQLTAEGTALLAAARTAATDQRIDANAPVPPQFDAHQSTYRRAFREAIAVRRGWPPESRTVRFGPEEPLVGAVLAAWSAGFLAGYRALDCPSGE